MVVEDVSFFMVNGEEVSRASIVQQMVDFYQLKLEVGDTRVTDFNEGSEIRNLLEGFAVDIYALLEEVDDVAQIGFVETATGEWLDKHGSNPLLQLPRELGSNATGVVTFSIPEATTSEVVVPADTILVSEDTGLEFATSTDCIISVGDTSATCLVECLTTGADGNAGTGTVTLFDDDSELYNGLTVTNASAFSGGFDYEEDEEYRERLLNYQKRDDFGSIPYYESLCNNVDGVHDVLFVTASRITRKCLVNGDTKPTPNSVLADVLEVLSDVNNVVVNHTFSVDKPSYSTQNLTVNLSVSATVDEDILEELIQCVFDGGECLTGASFDGMSIGQTLLKSELYGAFDLIEAVESVTILKSSTEISDLSVDNDEVLKLGTVTFNQTVVN